MPYRPNLRCWFFKLHACVQRWALRFWLDLRHVFTRLVLKRRYSDLVLDVLREYLFGQRSVVVH